MRETDLSGVDAVGVMGGDGSFREGVSGMLGRGEGDRCPIFVFPMGTGNNFARDLGVRTIEDMFAVIDRGATHAVDAVKAGRGGVLLHSHHVLYASTRLFLFFFYSIVPPPCRQRKMHTRVFCLSGRGLNVSLNAEANTRV